MATIAQLRQLFPNARSDEDAIGLAAKDFGLDAVTIANDVGYDGGRSSLTNERLSASKDNYDANLYGVGEAVTGAMGLNRARDWMRSGRQDNEFQANVAGQRAKELGGVDSYEDVGGRNGYVVDGLNYLGGLGAQALPYLGEAVAGGLVTRGLSTGLRAATTAGRAAEATPEVMRAGLVAQKSLNNRALVGGVAASYPSSVGDILGNQRDQLRANGLDDGQTDLLSAGIGGVAYAGLNALSPTERLMTQGSIGRGIGALDRMQGRTGGLARTGMNATGAGLLEGANETGQEFANQYFGRMAVDPNESFSNSDSRSRFAESFVGGAAMGGVLGGMAGGWRRSNTYVAESIKDGRPTNLLDRTRPLSGTQEQPNMTGFDEAFPENAYSPLPSAQPQSVDEAIAQLTELRDAKERLVSGLQTAQDAGDTKAFYKLAEQASPIIDRLDAQIAVLERVEAQVSNKGQQRLLFDDMGGDVGLRQQQLGYDPTVGAGDSMVTFPDGSTTTRSEYQSTFGDRPTITPAGAGPNAMPADAQATTRAEMRTAAIEAAKQKHAGVLQQAVDDLAGKNEDGTPVVKLSPKQVEAHRLVQEAHDRGWLSAEQFVDTMGALKLSVEINDTRGVTTVLNEMNALRKKKASQPQPAVAESSAPTQTQAPVPTAQPLAVARAAPTTPALGVPENRRVTVGRSGRKQELSPSELLQKILTAPAVAKRRILAATGWSIEPDPDTGEPRVLQAGSPLSFAEIARKEEDTTGKGVTRQAVAAMLQTYGLTEDIISRLASPSVPDTVSESELGVAPSEGAADSAPGFRVEASLAKATGEGVLEGGTTETGAQMRARVEANRILKMAPKEVGSDANTTPIAKEGQTVTDLRARNDVVRAANIRAALESDERVAAAADWQGDTPFEQLPDTFKADWIFAYTDTVQRTGGNFSNQDFQELTREQQAIEDEYAKYQRYHQTPAPTQPRISASGKSARGGSLRDKVSDASDAVEKPAGAKPARKTLGLKKPAEKPATPAKSVGESLWDTLHQAAAQLSPYDELTENERGFLDDHATARPDDTKLKGTALGDLVSSHLPGGALYNETQFSKSVPTEGSKADVVTAEIKKLLRLDALSSKVTVVQSVADLPAGVRQSVNVDAKTQGFVVKGKAYLVADNIAPGKARSVFLHEVGAHLGLENLLGKAQYAALVGKIKRWAARNDGSRESKLAQAAQQRVTDAGTDATQADSELLAYFIEEAVDAGVDPTATKDSSEIGRWVQRVWAAMKQALVRLGVRPESLTARDVVDMAYGAARIEAASGAAGKVGETLGRGAQGTTTPTTAKISSILTGWVQDVWNGKTREAEAGVSQVSPPVLKMLGFWNPIVIDVEHARHIKNTHPEIAAQDIGALSDLITHPRVVLQGSKPGKLELILDARTAGGDPLFVVLTKGKLGEFKITGVSTLYGMDDSAVRLVQKAANGQVLFMKKNEIARLHELQATASIAVNQGGISLAPSTESERSPASSGASQPAAITYSVLSDAALDRYKQNAAGAWKSATEELRVSPDSTPALKGAQFSKAALPRAVEQVAFSYGGGTAVNIAHQGAYWARKAVMAVTYLPDLVERFKKQVPALETWFNALQEVAATRREMEQEAEAIAALTDKLPIAGRDRANAFIARATVEQKWWKDNGLAPDQPTDAAMTAAFQALSVKERELVTRLFKYGQDMKTKKQSIFAAAKVPEFMSMYGGLEGPYAPLKRFGDFVVVLRSKELHDAVMNNETTLAEKLKADGKHYVVSAFDTMGAAQQFAHANRVENGGKYVFADASKKLSTERELSENQEVTFRKILAAAGANDKMPPAAKEAMTKLLRDMYVETLDNHHARLSGLHRLNRAGFDKDMVRSFLVGARADAAFLANVQHGETVSSEFRLMRDQAKNKDTGARENQDVVDTAAQHYAALLDTKDTPIQDRIVAATSIWQLATSVGYHVTNATQPWMVSLPRLAADFNDYAGAVKNLIDGYKTIATTGVWGQLDVASIKDAGLRKALELAQRANLLDVGQEQDLTRLESTRTGIAVVDGASAAIRRGVYQLRQVARAVEAANRIATITAAYNMAKKTMPAADAQAYAVKMVRDTQGDFTRTSAPLLLKKLPKAMTQYRKYQFMMAAVYVKAFNQAFAGVTENERAAGRRMLMYKLAHAGLAAGALGLPMANVVGMVAAAFGSDTEPPDFERWLREQFDDQSTADLVLRGPLSYLGLDMSAKLGEDKIFSIMPFGTWDTTSSAGLGKTVVGLLGGPSMAQAGRMADGLGAIKNGDYYKGVEKLMPKGVTSAMSAARIANEGYTLKNGDLMFKPEDTSSLALAFDALGLPSSRLKRMDWIKSQQYEIGQFFQARTREIEKDYARAVKDKDPEAMAAAREAWMNLQGGKDDLRRWFNDSHDALKKQPLSTLLKYPQTSQKREQKLQRSAPVTD